MAPSPETPCLHLDRDGVGRIVFDDPARRHNVLNRQVLGVLDTLITECDQAARNGTLRALLIESGKPHSFIAGADVAAVTEMAARSDRGAAAGAARFGQALFARLAALRVPTVAAVRGVCLGGGTELALACDYRLAADAKDTRLGLPEVQLGILPAWGGTTRLPRLVGLRAALNLMLTGKSVSPGKARRIGLVDQILPEAQFGERSREFACALAARGRQSALGSERGRRAKRGLAARFLDNTWPGRSLVCRTARKQVLKRSGGHYPAPLLILKVARQGLKGSVSASLGREANALGELLASAACRNLLSLFHLNERARKGPWADGGRSAQVQRVGVIGAGVMGGGIAQLAAYRDIAVRMKDIRHDAIQGGLAFARSVFDKAVKRRRLRRREAQRKMAQVSGSLSYDGFAKADLVVECVVERMDLKRVVLAEAEQVIRPGAVLTSNTSSLSIDEMAANLERPGNFAGMHFFNPVHRMPLVEVVRGSQTRADTVETVAALAARLGKVPVVTRDGPGFLVNRILGPCLNEAGHLLDEGLDAVAVDRIWKRFGVPMGPYRLIDEVGVDVAGHAGQSLADAFGERMAPAPALVALGRSGRLGRKGGRGFYIYSGKRTRFDPGVYADMGIPSARSVPAADYVRDRLVLAMINEAARILEEGIVGSAGEADLGMVMGTGFPPFRGGLLRYADDRGAADVYACLIALRDRHGERYEPSALIAELGTRGGTFHDAFPWKS